ncbi:MAG TPA: (2Fe-2S)-binding protein [Jatrophihabitans sp.]|jgi:nitrite reductase (NADH) large subunit|uniref:(2Fe-2S)-binding protein n=1 Tax=Jatrophihabitans sp. TaxID=1932789 RepID=UPI002F05A97D
MVICQCNRVTKREIESVVHAGARTPDQVTYETGAGSVCGSCLPALQAVCQRVTAEACDVCVGQVLVS